MAEYKDVALANLLLDAQNPRLDSEKADQPSALKAMMEGTLAPKVVELAADIAANGLSPLDGFLVMSAPGSKDDFIVLEGNRRVTALKLLANPSLGDSILTKKQVAKLTELAKDGATTNARKVTCAVVKSREEATHWLRLRHGGTLDGEGLFKWGARENARFEERRTGKKNAYLGLLSYLVNEGAVSEDEASAVRYTNLERVLSDAHVRSKLGVDVDKQGGVITTHYPKADTLKGLGALVKKLSVSTVYDIDKADNRKQFVAEMKADLPDPKKKLKTAQVVGGGNATANGGAGNGGTGGGAKKPKLVKEATTVAPASPALVIKHKRINRIYSELRKLKLIEHTNSGAVMLRVFLELTVDDYMGVHKIPKPKDETLRKKLRLVADHLEKNGVMTKHQLKPIRAVTDGANFLVTSVESLNAYVHNKDFHPSEDGVRTTWNNLEGLFVNIWK